MMNRNGSPGEGLERDPRFTDSRIDSVNGARIAAEFFDASLFRCAPLWEVRGDPHQASLERFAGQSPASAETRMTASSQRFRERASTETYADRAAILPPSAQTGRPTVAAQTPFPDTRPRRSG
jgi:hypothetical protein